MRGTAPLSSRQFPITPRTSLGGTHALLKPLNPADCDHILTLSDDGSEVKSISTDGMGYMFGGVRGCMGVSGGRWYFSVTLLCAELINVRDTDHLRTSMVVRVGVSQACTALGRLGEVQQLDMPKQAKPCHQTLDGKGTFNTSIGYSSTGSIVCDSQWHPNPYKYGLNDTVWVFLDLTCNPGRIGFAKNGEWLGFCSQPVAKPKDRDAALYSHILIRNCRVKVDISQPLPASLSGVGVNEQGGPYQPWAVSEACVM